MATEPASEPAPEPGAGAGDAADLTEPAELFLVRHGVTAATLSGLLDGRGGSDASLTPEGVRQARAVGEGLRRRLGEGRRPLVVTSTLRRARETGAEIAAVLGVERGSVVADGGWDEQHFGDWEGRTVAQVCSDDAGAAAYRRLRLDPRYARPGGESGDDLARRVRTAYDDAAARGRREGRPVVVVSHRAAILAVLDAALGLRSPWSLTLAPGSVTVLRRWADGGCAVDAVNDTAHLRG